MPAPFLTLPWPRASVTPMKRQFFGYWLGGALMVAAVVSLGLGWLGTPTLAASPLNACTILSATEISAVVGSAPPFGGGGKGLFSCSWDNDELQVIASLTPYDYSGSPGETVTPVAGLPAKLVVLSSSSVASDAVGYFHVLFSVKMKSYYWQVFDSPPLTVTQVETLARELYKALGGQVLTIQSASQREASDMKQIIADVQAVQGSYKAADKALCEEIRGTSGGSCSGTGSLAVFAAYVKALKGDQSNLAAELAFIDQSGHSAGSVSARVQAAQHSILALDSLLSETDSGGALGTEGSSGAQLKTATQDAVTTLTDLVSLLTAKEEQLNIQPSPTSEASNAAGF